MNEHGEKLLGFYEGMVRVMEFDRTALRLLQEGKVLAGYHSGRGQEAVAVGGCAALRPDDYIMYDHRGCGHVVAKGLSMTAAFGDFMGNVEGATRGLGAGIPHFADPDLGILGQGGTLGTCFPIAAGAAFSAKYRGTDQVMLCFFGDGTANRGTFHESVNAAAALRLPVIWLCENNGYAVSMPASQATAGTDRRPGRRVWDARRPRRWHGRSKRSTPLLPRRSDALATVAVPHSSRPSATDSAATTKATHRCIAIQQRSNGGENATRSTRWPEGWSTMAWPPTTNWRPSGTRSPPRSARRLKSQAGGRCPARNESEKGLYV